MQAIRSFVDGRFVEQAASATIPVINPANEQVIGEVQVADEGVVDTAVVAAEKAFTAWSQTAAHERSWYLNAIADALEENTENLALCESRDTGMTLRMTREGHLPRAVEHFRYYAGEVTRYKGECIPMDDAYIHLVQRIPMGPVALLVPWSAPLAVASLNIAAVLAAGNTCIVKPSERAPMSTAALAEIIQAVELPRGVCNIVQGGAEVGSALVHSAGVKAICFVGGSHVGRIVAANAAMQMKRIVLELGGKSPTIVLRDANLQDAIDGALISAFSSNGEVCTAGSRIIVEDPLYDDFVACFTSRVEQIRVGDPLDSQTEMGPLIDGRHMDDVLRRVQEGVEDGGNLLCGGTRVTSMRSGFFVSPAVFAQVTNSMRIAREEIFGPVASIIRASDSEAALAIANDSPYGLAATVWTTNVSRGLSLASRIQAGVVGINSPVIRDLRVPFGGMKSSGLGRVGGRAGLDQFTELRVITIPVNGYNLPRYGAPH